MLWGFDSLSFRELDAVFMGNLPLLFSLEVLIWVDSASWSALQNLKIRLASIWKLPVIKMLLAFPEFQKLRIMQDLSELKAPHPLIF